MGECSTPVGGSRATHTTTSSRLVRLAKTVGWLTFAGATVLSCGSTEGGGGVDSLDELLQELAASVCRGDCDDSGAAYFELAYGEACLELMTLLYEAVGANMQASLDAGRSSFDAKKAQRCLDARAEGSCDEAEIACDEVFVGHVAIGDGCIDSVECAGNAFCNTEIECPGKCQARRALGEPCTYYDECEHGLDCWDDVCVARKGLGELCQSDDECHSHNCEGGLAERYCTEAQQLFEKDVGELCDYNEECKPNLYCPDGACAPAAAVGDDCTLGTPCVHAAYCLEESCVKGVALGEACESSDQCAVGVCDGGTCQKHSPLGGPCVTAERCFGACENGACAPYPLCFAE